MKMCKLTFLSIVGLCLTASVYAQTYSGGSGTVQDPYLISSKADMAALSIAVNGGNAYSGKYFLLTQDLTGISTRIGNSSTYCFNGVFDGDGYMIDVDIDVSGSGSVYGGVFGYISGATIKNLGVSGNVSSSSSSYYSYAGGICGYATNSTISNCYNTGSVSSSSSSSYSYSYAGGICGYATNSTISNCYNTGSVSSSSSYYSSYAGGICGRAPNSIISNCYNTGSVSSSSSSSSSSAGGICGEANKITGCFAANANITSKRATSNDNIGRIVSSSSGTVEISYALSSMLLNGTTVSSQSLTSHHGKDGEASSFQSQAWIEDNLFWDFVNTWYIPDNAIAFPVLKKETKIEFALSSNTLTYGDIWQMELSATSNHTNAPIVFASSNNEIAEVVGTILKIKKAGTVSITASQSDGNEYKPASANVSLTINKKALTITANSTSMIYGDTPQQYTCQYDGFVSGETQNNLAKLPVFACTATSTSNVGNYTITPSGAESDNYTFTYKTGILIVQKRTLIVTPNNASRVYGSDNNTFILFYDGFVNGNTTSSISTKPTGYSNATRYSNVGEYEITCSGGFSTNYDFAYGTGIVTITKAPLTISANSAHRYYGEDNPSFSVSYTGFKNSETAAVLSSLPQVFCGATKSSDVGTYPIVIAENITAINYDIKYTNGALHIYKISLTAKAENKTRYENEPNPEFTIAYSGFVNGENESVLDVAPQASCYANEESYPGMYTIYVNGGSDNNYEIYRQTGTLTILPSETGLEEIASQYLSVYPNPVKNYLYIRSDYPIEKVEVYDSSGVLVLVENSVAEKIDVSALARGFYLARIFVQGTSVVQRVVVGE